ncbi:MAG: hypothetical protein KAT10_03600, partial [Sulfurimonas sp.]|nr:hypothetical protein [Sulfurimonas sp.]
MSNEALNGIYIEAALFMFVVLVMSIASYKISSKHAKEYAMKNQKNINARREAKKDEIKSKEDRVEELQEMLDNSMITDDEFKMMKHRLYNT